MRRLLVTGGAGFIGSNFVHYWLRTHPEDRLVVLDALTYAGNLANLDHVIGRDALRFVEADIRNQGLVVELLRAERIDTVVHFAAESHVDRSISGPDAFIETNVLGTHSLLKAARQVWLTDRRIDEHRFHHVSTDEVYGSLEFDSPPFTETTPYAPNSPYSASKAASDHLVRAYHHTFGLKTTTTNCSNNYGPFHFPEKLIPRMIVNILEGAALPVYGDGLNVRDWLHVSDHCRAIDAVLGRGRVGEVYNIGGGEESTNIDLVRALCAIVDDEFRSDAGHAAAFPAAPPARGESCARLISFVEDRPGHDRRYAINCDKAAREVGYRAEVHLADGLRQTVRWYLSNQDWWRSILDGRYRRRRLGAA